MIARGMSSNGKRLAALFGIAIAFFLPKHVECGFPGAACSHAGPFKLVCRDYEMEPLGFFLLESVAHRDLGFAYSSGEDCH